MKFIGIDTETFYIQHSVCPPVVCMTTYDETTGERAIFGREQVSEEAERLLMLVLAEKDVVLVAQNACFDFVVLATHNPRLLPLISAAYKQKKIVCTKLAEILMNSADPREAGRANPPRFLRRGEGEKMAFGMSNQLGGMVIYYLREDITANKSSDLRTSYASLVDVPVDQWSIEAREYAMMDAVYVVRVLRQQIARANRLAKKLRVASVLVDLPRQSYVEFILQLQAMTIGVRVDPLLCEDAKQELLEEQDSAMPLAIELGLFVEDKRSPRGYKKGLKRLQAVLADISRITGYTMETTKTGALATSEGELKTVYEKVSDIMNRGYNVASKLQIPDAELMLLGEYVEAMRAYQQSEKAWKAKSTFVDALAEAQLNPDNRVRFGYQGLKETGRTSSREPNMQNLPRGGKTRSCIIPREGHIFLQADYSNAELRTLAQIHIDEGRESALAREYKKNKDFDPHLYAALEMLRVEGVDLTYAQGKSILKQKDHPQFKALKSKRQFAKVANFGYAGGLGATKFVSYAGAQDLKLTLEQAKELREAWLNVWIEMREYFKVRSMQTEGIGDLTDRDIQYRADEPGTDMYDSVFKFSRSGRHRFLRNYTIGCNTGFQGMAADGAKEALILIHEECFFKKDSPLYRSVPVLFVHDEVIVETPFKEDTHENRVRASAAARRLKELMEQGMNLHTPDIPAVVEPCLSVKWSKDMESRVLEDGTLSIFGVDK